MKFRLTTLSVVCLLSFHAEQSNAGQSNVSLEVSNIVSHGGTIHIGFYATSDDYVSFSNPIYSLALKPEKGSVSMVTTVKFKAGEYAVAGYHDLNDNGKLDFSGPYNAPTEPLIYGNGAMGTYGIPEYDDVLVKVTNANSTIELAF
jgi:uncharacterized protein (DUF2141 family)